MDRAGCGRKQKDGFEQGIARRWRDSREEER